MSLLLPGTIFVMSGKAFTDFFDRDTAVVFLAALDRGLPFSTFDLVIRLLFIKTYLKK